MNLRVPADLYGWNDRAVPMNVRYRYTAPSTYNDSVLSVDINEQLVRSYRLKPLTAQNDESLVSVPLISGGSASVSNEILIPAFRVGSNNQMQFRFHMDSQKTGLCASTAANVARAAVDPDSSIDFSGFSHYAALPNLAFFANSGYPFTRLADTGRYRRGHAGRPERARPGGDADAARPHGQVDRPAGAARGGGAGQGHRHREGPQPADGGHGQRRRDPGAVGQVLPILVQQGRTEITLRDQRGRAWTNWLSGEADHNVSPAGRAILSADGPLAALIGFESPYAAQRSVVAVTATAPENVRDVLDVLEDAGKVAQIRGDLTVVRQREVERAAPGRALLRRHPALVCARVGAHGGPPGAAGHRRPRRRAAGGADPVLGAGPDRGTPQRRVTCGVRCPAGSGRSLAAW